MGSREELRVRRSDKGTAEVYRFWFEPMGWAFFVLDDETGWFGIESDWGNYGHTWPSPGRGKESLKHFVATAGCEYIATKFSYDREREFSKTFDEEGTRSQIKKDIVERRRDRRMEAEEAREVWDALERWGMENENAFHYDMPDEIQTFYCGDLCELAHYKPSARFDFLVGTLLPFFQDVLKKELSSGSAKGVLRSCP